MPSLIEKHGKTYQWIMTPFGTRLALYNPPVELAFTSASSSTSATYPATVEGTAGLTVELFLGGVSQGSMTESSSGVYSKSVTLLAGANSLSAKVNGIEYDTLEATYLGYANALVDEIYSELIAAGKTNAQAHTLIDSSYLFSRYGLGVSDSPLILPELIQGANATLPVGTSKPTIISEGLSFDSVDDYVPFTISPALSSMTFIFAGEIGSDNAEAILGILSTGELRFRKRTGTNLELRTYDPNNGGGTLLMTMAQTPSINTRFMAAFSYETVTGAVQLKLDNNAITTATGQKIGSMSNFTFGRNGYAGDYFLGKHYAAVIVPSILTNAEISAFYTAFANLGII